MTLSMGMKLIFAFVTLIIGVVLIGSIATEGLDKTTYTVVDTAESKAMDITGATETSVNTTAIYTVDNAPTTWKSVDCGISGVVITNASGGNPLTVDTDYTLTPLSGSYVLKDTATTDEYIGPDNVTLVTYSYCGDEYMNIGWGRTIINLVPGFFAIAILLASVVLFYSVGKEAGIV